LPVDAEVFRSLLGQMLVAGTEPDDGIVAVLKTFVRAVKSTGMPVHNHLICNPSRRLPYFYRRTVMLP